ncbi:MAG: hypothetical protein R6V50_04035, partial [Thermoplasmatota archaeon]
MSENLNDGGWKRTKGLRGEERWTKQVLLENIGAVTFIRHKTKKKHWLTIYTPPFTFPAEKYENVWGHNEEIAREALNWFMK